MTEVPSPEIDREVIAEFLLRLRGQGVRDLAVLRACETVPRDRFVPGRYRDLGSKDLALPIACGQTMTEPHAAARAVQALRPTSDCRVLEIGAGSGYVSAILSRIAAEVLAVERFRRLVDEAAARLTALAVTNATVVWGDGLAVATEAGPFDRVLIHAAVPGLPAPVAALLRQSAVAVYARSDADDPRRPPTLVRAERDREGLWTETALGPSRLRPLLAGVSLGL